LKCLHQARKLNGQVYMCYWYQFSLRFFDYSIDFEIIQTVWYACFSILLRRA
jgi:hypothetical protein